MRHTFPGRQWVALVAFGLSLPLLVFAFSSGAPAGFTGGFGEATCTACHGGSGGPGSVTIHAPEHYVPGENHEITVRVADPNQRRWGFQLSARTEGGQQAGQLSRLDDNTQCSGQLFDDDFCLPVFNGTQYITHSSSGTRRNQTGSADFTFNWQAPDMDAGNVVFHAAGNAANNDGTSSGDRIYATSLTMSPAEPGPPAQISPGGIVNNASFVAHPAPVAPGSIAAIFGINLNNGSEIAHSAFQNGRLLTTLGGARVTIGGFSAPLFYSFPGQLGVQVPFELAGQASAEVRVTVAGQQSPPETVFLDILAPGLFASNQAGSGQGAITHADGAPVTPQSPARRGDVVILYATGLGEVTPPLETGEASVGNVTSTTATVLIDGLPATVEFSGAAPGFVGLYQINVRVPLAARLADDVIVALSIGARHSNVVTIAVAP